MVIKKFKIHKPALSTVLSISMIAGSLAGSAIYYNVETTNQVREENNQQIPMFTTEDGKICGYFDVGEHIIKVSRNDVYTYRTEEIEGYTIKEVEVNSWRDNNQITYVNTLPVVVLATQSKDGEIEFNTFGTIEQPQVEKTGKSK